MQLAETVVRLVKELIFRKAASTVTLAVNNLTSIFHGFLSVFHTHLFQSTPFSEYFSEDVFISIYTFFVMSLKWTFLLMFVN